MPLLEYIPEWLARPMALLSTAGALTGAGFIFWSAATGSYWWAIWGAVAFAAAGLLWYLSDYAATTAPAGRRPLADR